MLIACIDLSNGVFLSSASPVYEQNAVGIQSVAPVELLLINAGEVQSHAVYPLASNVALSPPDGNDDASGSPLINSFPENSINTFPLASGAEINESCFSAVTPVKG